MIKRFVKRLLSSSHDTSSRRFIALLMAVHFLSVGGILAALLIRLQDVAVLLLVFDLLDKIILYEVILISVAWFGLAITGLIEALKIKYSAQPLRALTGTSEQEVHIESNTTNVSPE